VYTGSKTRIQEACWAVLISSHFVQKSKDDDIESRKDDEIEIQLKKWRIFIHLNNETE